MNTIRNPLRLNVGFITQKPVGFSRIFAFNYDNVSLETDLLLDFLRGQAEVSRTPQGLFVQVTLDSQLKAECARCLTEFPQGIKTDFSEMFAFAKRGTSKDDLTMPEDGFIDLNPTAREQLLLEIPINPICKPDCKGLCPICGGNLNEEQCNHDDETGDPRFQILKSLQDK